MVTLCVGLLTEGTLCRAGNVLCSDLGGDSTRAFLCKKQWNRTLQDLGTLSTCSVYLYVDSYIILFARSLLSVSPHRRDRAQ